MVRSGSGSEVLLGQALHLLTVHGPETVDDVEDGDPALGHVVEGLVQVPLHHLGDGHQVDGHLVALVQAVVGHGDGRVHLVDVAGHPDHGEQALVPGRDVVVVDAADVHHGRQLQAARLVADDPADVLIPTELPGAVLVAGEGLLRTHVAHLHVVHPGGAEPPVDGPDELVAEVPVVHQPAVTDGAVQDFDRRSIHGPCSSMKFVPSVCGPRIPWLLGADSAKVAPGATSAGTERAV